MRALLMGKKKFTGIGIFHNPALGIISFSSDGINYITTADKNLGATQVYHVGDAKTQANCGNLYQWGNNHGFPYGINASPTSNTQVDVTGYGPGNYYDSSAFVIGVPQWCTSASVDNLWGGVTDTNASKQGPCPNGFHIPSKNELDGLYNIMQGLGTLMLATYGLRPGTAGEIIYFNGNFLIQNWQTAYFSSTYIPNGGAYALSVGETMGSRTEECQQNSIGISYGCFIRPFANTPVIPDSTRTILYQP